MHNECSLSPKSPHSAYSVMKIKCPTDREQRAVYSALIYRGHGKAGLDLFPGLASTVPSLEIAFSFSLEKGAQTSVKGGFSEN